MLVQLETHHATLRRSVRTRTNRTWLGVTRLPGGASVHVDMLCPKASVLVGYVTHHHRLCIYHLASI